MLKIFLIFSFFQSLSFNQNLLTFEKQEKHTNNLADVIFEILSNDNGTAHFNIYENSIDLKHIETFNDLLEKISHKIVDRTIKVDRLERFNENDTQNAITLIVLESVGSIGKFCQSVKVHSHQKFLLHSMDIENELDIEQVVRELWRNYIVNVIVFMMKDENVFLYTYSSFNANNCRMPELNLINYFNGTFANKTDFFPNKLKNLNQCDLKVSMNSAPPFIFTNEDKKTIPENDVEGIDASLLKELSFQLNFKYEICFVKVNKQWGQIFPNGSSTGSTRLVSKKRILSGKF